MITQVEARGEVFALFKESWDVETEAIAGYVPHVEYQGVQPRPTPDTEKHWARISIQTVGENQTSLSTSEGAAGQKRYTAYGLIFVQIFSPRSLNNGFDKGLQLADIAKNAFRGKTTPGKIWFRNVRVNELEPENSFYRLNVVAEFEYDEQG